MVAQLYAPRRPEGIIEQYEPIDDENEIIYKCARCGAEMTYAELKMLPSVKCINCGFRVLYKVRARGSKIIRAI
ncbi:RNA polymerase Rbp10 [Pyrolobus fumarii 1A]|uniref:DNA-directed RNA polymerase subunit Rpo12 n=1 Tax=Pyrolobus fumarii (strain DSM 11204 / 1A) TaxID=694429 RepID=G0ED28_PYRF1|nr:RNA polymerase Rbp10 [Pyrolobus fumarii]AEM38587.1 RNA polymerase Rbp10 [Pyrolobus fumarii 1A]